MRIRALQPLLLLLVGLMLVASCRAQEAKPAQTPTAAPAVSAADRWEPAIAKFEANDKKNPPPKGAVLFVGSSSIGRWKTLKEDFPGVTTLNRGFGGSTIPDVLRYLDRIVIPYAPRQIVFYCGDNDLAAKGAAKRTPEQVFANFKTFVERVRKALPETRITFISLKPSPSRWQLRDEVQKANRLISDWIQSGAVGKADYIDVWTPMLGSDGQPRPELFVADRLHMTPEGYKIWTRLVTPTIIPEKNSP